MSDTNENAVTPIHTCCKECVFAKYNDKTQVGCHLNYVEQFDKSSVLEAYDDEKEFYVINNKKCIGYREQDWFDKRGMKDATTEEKVAKYHSKNFLHYGLVVDLKDFNDTTDLEVLGRELKSLEIAPRIIILVRHQSQANEKEHAFYALKPVLEQSELGCRWRIVTALEDIDYLDIVHELTNRYKNRRFLLSVAKPTTGLNELVNRANRIAHTEMQRFVALSNEDGNAVLISTPNYRHSLFTQNVNILTETSLHNVVS